eukprot:scaffold1.g5702.t1
MEAAPSGVSLPSMSESQSGALPSTSGQPNGVSAVPSPSNLTDELARRLQLAEQQGELPAEDGGAASGRASTPELYGGPASRPDTPAPPGAATPTTPGGGGGLEVSYFCEARHDEQASSSYDAAEEGVRREGLVSKWRQKERLKTTAVALVVCLNIGVDPPDVIKISPCARLECWVDPLSMQAPKALDTIGKNLQAQYERWQPRAKYRMHLDPTTEDVKRLAISCRRTAKARAGRGVWNERVLFHYNGHGVPRPTANGEIWVFNKSYTQYIPLSIYDLQTWVGTPAIYVFDCSAAGQILNRCSGVALRWFVSRSLLRHEGVTKELIDRIPGKQASATDRKTPLGELNWIFTAITGERGGGGGGGDSRLRLGSDRAGPCAEGGPAGGRGGGRPPVRPPARPPAPSDTIAWNVLPRALFQKLFRQDLLVASLFRNFLLAERVLRAANCTPLSHPRLPPTHQHAMWQAWDMAAEMCLLQVVGIFPYVLKLLQTTAPDLRQTLVFIWAKILAWDANAQVQGDLVKDGGHLYFVKHLEARDAAVPPESRAQAAFVLAAICDRHPKGQLLCAQAGLLQVCAGQLPAVLAALAGAAEAGRRARAEGSAGTAVRGMNLLVKWLLLAVGKLCEDLPEVTAMALREAVQDTLVKMLAAEAADIRAAAVFSLGALVLPRPPGAEAGGGGGGGGAPPEAPPPVLGEGERAAMERAIAAALLEMVYDASPLVRAEVASSLARLAVGHSLLFQDAVHAHQRTSARILREAAAAAAAAAAAGAARSAPPAAGGSAPASAGGGGAAAAAGLCRGDSSGNLPAGAASAGAAGAAAAAAGASADRPSPGVRVRDDLAYEPMLHVGLEASIRLGAYASADAARVGGGLYLAVVEALCTLATDPSPRVAAAGRAALKAANVELVPVSAGCGGAAPAGAASRAGGSAPSSPRFMAYTAFLPLPSPALGGGSTPAGGGGGGGGGGVASLIPRSWQPKSWRSASLTPRTSTQAAALAPAGAGRPPSAPASPAASPSSSSGGRGGAFSAAAAASCSRPPFVLRRAPDAGDAPALGGAPPSRTHSAQSTGSLDLPPCPASAATLAAEAARAAAAALPPSPVFRLSCRHFTWPLLVPQASEEASPSYAYWTRPPDAAKVAARRRKRREDLARSASVGSPDRAVRLREQVVPVDTGAARNVAIALDPVRPLLVVADGEGVARVCSFGGQHPPTLVNRFHVATGDDVERGAAAPPTVVAALFQLNELHNSLLLACAADGAVRAYRNHAMRGGQRLATAWQSVLVAGAGAPGRPAVYDWAGEWGALFSAGGRATDRIYMWDLERECCAVQMEVSSPPRDHCGAGAAVTHLAASRTSPLLFAAEASGTVRVYDLRAGGAPVGGVTHQRGRLAGLAAEPGGTPHQLVLGYPSAHLAFLDCRMLPGAPDHALGVAGQPRLEVGVWKSFDAHSKGPMACLTAHRYAPLLATATASQVWSARGEQVGVWRTHTSFLAQRIGSVKQLVFAPYDLRLASGGDDGVVAVYGMDVGPTSASPSRPPLPSPPSLTPQSSQGL